MLPRSNRLIRLLGRRPAVLAAGCAVLLALPALRAPLLHDDVVHRVMLLDRAAGVHWGPTELYDFIGAPERTVPVLRDHGYVPWFAADDLAIRFHRPLSSLLLAADESIGGVFPAAWLLVVHATIGIAYLAIYVAQGYGARGSGLYLDHEAFVYFNTNLQMPRLVFSADLSDPTTDLAVLARRIAARFCRSLLR